MYNFSEKKLIKGKFEIKYLMRKLKNFLHLFVYNINKYIIWSTKIYNIYSHKCSLSFLAITIALKAKQKYSTVRTEMKLCVYIYISWSINSLRE